MIRLRRLYVEQFSNIQYTLKEKRLKYIQAQRLEDETFSVRNHHNSPDYKLLKAMLKYHKTFGSDYFLQDQAKRLKQNRSRTNETRRTTDDEARHIDGAVDVAGPRNNCVFSKTPQGCDKASLPLSPYCRQHILYDKRQVLFRPCAGGMPPCLSPVVSFIRKNRCRLHTGIN